MTDQPAPEMAGEPVQEVAPEAGAEEAQAAAGEAGAASETVAAQASGSAVGAGLTVPEVATTAAAASVVAAAAPPPATVAPSWTASPPPQTPPPAGSGWTTSPTPAAGAGWSAYVQSAASPGGPAPGWEYAGFWIRALAYFIDGIILGVVTTVLWLVVLAIAAAIGIGAAASSTSTGGTLTDTQWAVIGVGIAMALLFLVVMSILVTVLYFVLLWVKRGGTLGQTLLGMRIARESDGAPIGWGTAILRYVILLVGFWVFYLGVIWVAFEPRKRGWHDLVAGTVVVRRV